MKQNIQLFYRGTLITIILLAVLVLLAGCVSAFGMVKTQDVTTQTIKWEKNVPSNCGDYKNIHACASVSSKNCTITMDEDAPDWIVAHEFRHCFGYVHGDK